ncbi:hypothetical protein OK016_10090 [Vibrio chagasii]|nr:hypothetical protein [Vibrio chagasii]
MIAKKRKQRTFVKWFSPWCKTSALSLIKLADRTHNMRTLGALRPDKSVVLLVKP